MLNVLIAEDNLMLADMLEALLVEHGYKVCGIARTVAEGVALARIHKPDLAILDVRLADGGLGTEIVSQLEPNRLGVLYASGNVSQIVLGAANGHASITKPYTDADLVRGLEIVTDIVATGRASPPFPPGFHLLQSEESNK